MKIFKDAPKDWRDLEIKTTKIFSEIGCNSSNQVDMETVRGRVNIDVVAKDTTQHPHLVYFCECKYWESAIPQNIIHAFRTVVADSGAHCGFIIAKKGFQSGSFEAVKNTNVYLLNWDEFIETFKERWLKKRIDTLHSIGKPLYDFCNPTSTFFLDNLRRLSSDAQKEFENIIKEYHSYATISLRQAYYNTLTGDYNYEEVIHTINGINKRILCSQSVESISDYFDLMMKKCEKGLKQVDDLLKERIRKNKSFNIS